MEYQRRINRFIELFSGMSIDLIAEIKIKMVNYALDDEFEKAATVKEGLAALNSIINYLR